MKNQSTFAARRAFLKTGAGFLAAACCSPGEWQAALHAAQRTRKQILTIETFNRRIPSPDRTAQFSRFIRDVQGGLQAYLEREFELTETQKKNLAQLPADSTRALNAALERAAKEKLKITVKQGVVGERKGCDLKPYFTDDGLVINVLNPRA